jgi:tetratricopeptide (TPR) repeat protein
MNNVSFEEKWIEKIKTDMEKIQENIEKHEIKDAGLFLILATYETCPRETCYETKDSGNQKRAYYLNKALETDPQNPHIYLELARYHAQYREYEKAENFYLKVLETDQQNNIYNLTLIELANLYLKIGKQSLADETFRKAVDTDYDMYAKNYQSLYQTLKTHDIKLIAAQYPIRSIEPLELIFKNNSDVILVDNELLFKNLVKEEGYDSVFVDRFAGDFGHCTERGNLFLAENIKSVLLENWEELSGGN